MDIISFSKHILDHRIDRRKEHSVETIVYIAMAAVICGAESWGEIEAFGICKKDFFILVFLDKAWPCYYTLQLLPITFIL